MGNYLAYPWAILYGLYYYVLFQFIYLVRFGSFNMNTGFLDIFLFVNGILSVLLCMYFSQKLARGRAFMWIPFLLALPFSVVGALGGGLVGAVGILAGGLVPFAIALPIGFLVIKKFAGNMAMPPLTPPMPRV